MKEITQPSKEQRIMQAMLDLVNENGIHNTPMSQVSKRSGVSTGAIYHYFESKEELIRALYVNVKTQLVDAALEGYDIKADVQARFVRIWRNHFDYLVVHPAHFSFIEQCSISPMITPDCKQEVNDYARPILGFLHEAIAFKKLKELDVELMIFLIYGSISAAVRMQMMHGELSDTQIGESVQYCWDGLKYA